MILAESIEAEIKILINETKKKIPNSNIKEVSF